MFGEFRRIDNICAMFPETIEPRFSSSENSHGTMAVAAARALNGQDASGHEEQMIAYDNAIRALEAKCQKLEENARIMERNHKEETTSLRQAVQELNAENEELANDVQEMLGESDELQQTLEQLARANRIMKDKNQLLRQERDSLLEQLETTKHLLKQREEDPQEVHHWKYTMKRQLNLITEEKNALENALNRANNEKDNIYLMNVRNFKLKSISLKTTYVKRKLSLKSYRMRIRLFHQVSQITT